MSLKANYTDYGSECRGLDEVLYCFPLLETLFIVYFLYDRHWYYAELIMLS